MGHRIPSTLLVPAVVFGLLCTTRLALAGDPGEDLQAQIKRLEARVAELEHRSPAPASAQDLPAFGETAWNMPSDPFREIERMNYEMQRMFDNAFRGPLSSGSGMLSNRIFVDASGLQSTDNGYLVKLNTSGFDQNNIDINVTGHSLSISGEYTNGNEQNTPDTYVQSHQYGKFLNTIPLPDDADTSKMKTEQKGNVLEIFFPRKGATQPT